MSEVSKIQLREEEVDLEALAKPHSRGCLRSFRALRLYLTADLHRYHAGRFHFWRHFLFTPGYKYTFWMRLSGYLKTGRITRLTLYPIAKFILLHCRYKYGIAIPEYTEIDPGLFINRFGGIYMHGHTKIGHDVTLSAMTMIGQTNRGKRAGTPTIGNRVFMGVGAKVIGKVTVGDDSAIGVSALVTRDVPPNSVVAGIPAKVISEEGSEGYVNRTVPAELLAACYAANGRALP
ncbi:serine acetyltransferase [Altererythrobacter sp. Root672]|uniref:serine acetyltransferase n=1 Tax=Altererythrobacter sp. Root672 TaxID=1736584 RepID=UPI0006F428DF|nr:hexapeptide transferase [Altererythrobacter sp. Root672]KRA84444.1 hexapeptide transferase [Altererythrobacter sp. Root672]